LPLVSLALLANSQAQILHHVPHARLERPSTLPQQAVLSAQQANILLSDQVHVATVGQEPLLLKELLPVPPVPLVPIQVEEARPVRYAQEVSTKVPRELHLVTPVQQASTQPRARQAVATAASALIQLLAQVHVLHAQEGRTLT